MVCNYLIISVGGQSTPPINQPGVRSGENYFCIVSGPARKRPLKLDIIVNKAAIVTYLWSYFEDLENYQILILR